MWTYWIAGTLTPVCTSVSNIFAHSWYIHGSVFLSFVLLYCSYLSTAALLVWVHLYCLWVCVWVFCVWVFCVWVSVLTGPSSGGHLYCLAASIACGRPVAIQVTPWSPSTVSKWLHELVDSIWLQSYIKNCHRNMWMSGRERVSFRFSS